MTVNDQYLPAIIIIKKNFESRKMHMAIKGHKILFKIVIFMFFFADFLKFYNIIVCHLRISGSEGYIGSTMMFIFICFFL